MNDEPLREKIRQLHRKYGRKVDTDFMNDLLHLIAEDREKRKRSLRDELRDDISKLNWARVLDEAIKSRPTSWKQDPVWEYRNASDEVKWAMMRACYETGVFDDPWKQAADAVKAQLPPPDPGVTREHGL